MKTVVVVDYGMGNLRSVSQAVQHVAAQTGHRVEISSDPDAVRRAERIVLPGQGAMRDCMAELDRHGLRAAVVEAAGAKPLFGICVGMQMLLDHSDEQDTPGLGLVAGHVRRFDLQGRTQPDGFRYKVPQMGWNTVEQNPHALWAGVPDASHFYFVHSYHAQPQQAQHSVGHTDYGGRFTSALARDNIFATQFHPEKSAAQGLALFRNFLHWQP